MRCRFLLQIFNIKAKHFVSICTAVLMPCCNAQPCSNAIDCSSLHLLRVQTFLVMHHLARSNAHPLPSHAAPCRLERERVDTEIKQDIRMLWSEISQLGALTYFTEALFPHLGFPQRERSKSASGIDRGFGSTHGNIPDDAPFTGGGQMIAGHEEKSRKSIRTFPACLQMSEAAHLKTSAMSTDL